MTPDDRPQRRGFFARMSEMLAPTDVPDDDGGPLRTPRTVVAAMVASILGGVLYVFSGLAGLATLSAAMTSFKTDYAGRVNECTSRFGGFGTDVITSEAPTGLAADCRALPVITDADWDGIRTSNQVLLVFFIVAGLLLIGAGYFLRVGRIWARRAVVWVMILMVIAAFLLGIGSPLILAGTLAVMLAVMLCYIGSGGMFFILARRRGHV